MDNTSWRYVLIIDWAAIENTPHRERHPSRIERWQNRAQRFAAAEGLDPGDVVFELRREGRHLAERQRHDQLAELARDMAVSKALGESLQPVWQHRLSRLVRLMGQPKEAVRTQIEQLAAGVQVSVLS